MKFSMPVPSDFNLLSTVYSHGWSALRPFRIVKGVPSLGLVYAVGNHTSVQLEVRQQDEKNSLTIISETALGVKIKSSAISIVRSCLRLDEDFSELYDEAKHHPQYRWILKAGAGRLLRSPTVFEDVVKMICTTNCSWALTEIMAANLCVKLGTKVADDTYLFPSPEAIADCSEKYIRKEIRAGYRSPYLLELSRKVAKGAINLESWRHSTAPTDVLFEEVRSVKGIGPYAAGNILKLLGRYDYLGIDSWCRKKFFEIHKNGKTTSDKAIERFYAPFGRWRGLFFWLDVTKHWYNEKFPF